MATTTTTETAQFAPGSTYVAGGGSSYTWTFEVVKRTAKFITVRDIHSGKVSRCGVRVHSNREWASPLGTYSMAPVMCADAPI